MADAWDEEDEPDRVRDGRRQLSIDVSRIECRVYRRTRTAADFTKHMPHLTYMVRCHWSGDPLPAKPPSIYPEALMYDDPLLHQSSVMSAAPLGAKLGSPRWEHDQQAIQIVRRTQTHPWRKEGAVGRGGSSYCRHGGFWWDDLPRSYTLRRRWPDIVKFHEALVGDLAFDKERGCRRVKAKIPKLPNKADLDTFLQGCAATGDAMAMMRREPLQGDKGQMQSLEELDDVHWIYVEKRMAPYFAEVNRILREVPTQVLLASHALRHFVTAGGVCGLSVASTRKATPVITRFLGPLTPMQPSEEDLAAAARQLGRNKSAPSLMRAGSTTLKASS